MRQKQTQNTKALWLVKTLWLVLMMAVVSWGMATTYTVMTNGDAASVCTGTSCPTLRDALGAAADGDTITFDSSLAGLTITLTTALPDITVANLTIDASALASGITVERSSAGGTPQFRVFNHTGSGTFTINNLVVTKGNATGNGGGGIFSSGDVTITNSTISGNTASTVGGGIFSSGAVTLTNSTISGNTSGNGGGGIFSSGAVTLTNSTISGNEATSGNGGGIASVGIVTLTDSTISGNTAGSNGGGIYSFGAVTLTNSTIKDNTAGGNGGGIWTNNQNLTLNGCTTIETNTAPGAGDQWNVGTGTVSDGSTLASSRDADYSGPACGTPQTITFGMLSNKTIGDADFAVSATASSGLAVTFTSATPGVCTVSSSTVSLVATGTCTINANQAGGTSGGNTYTAAPQVQQDFTVAKKDLTATVNPASREYGDANPAFDGTSVTYTGLITGDTNADITTPPTLSTTATATTPVGTADITCDVAPFTDDNYTLSSCTGGTGTLTITPAPLTVTAANVTITEGDTPTFTANITGFKNSETDAVLTTPVSFADDAPDYNTAGIYTITPSGAAAANYTFTYATGTLTIQSAGFDITQSGGNTAVTEGGATDTIQVVLTSIPTADVDITVTPDAQLNIGAGAGTADTLTFTPANWDTVQPINVTANDDTDVEGAHTGTLSFTVASGDGNYDAAVLADITVAITDDEPGVFITPNALAVTEGGATSYDVVLNTAPANNITITITPDAQTDVGAGAGVATTLDFTVANATTPQTVNVTAVDDTEAEGDHTSTITHAITTGDGHDYTNALILDDVIVTISDNDSAGVIINPDPDMQIRNGDSTTAASITSGTTVNIGSFNRGEVATINFLVRNPSSAVLEIGELVLPSFLSNAGEALPETLASFESSLLTLSVDTNAAGALEGTFSLASNDPDAFENPFVFTIKGNVSETPANVLNILPGVDIGEVSTAAGQDDVVLLSFKLIVPEGSVPVTVDSLTLAASNLGIQRASNLRLYIDGGTRGQLDNRDVFLSTADTQTLSFDFNPRIFQPNLPMWFIVVGDF